MPTSLKPLGSPAIGTSIDFGLQATGANNVILTRDFEMRIADRATYLVPVVNQTTVLYDDVFTSALIVKQQLLPIPGNEVDCILRRMFAEVPTSWDDFGEENVTFFGVAPSVYYNGGGIFAFRSQPVTERVPVRIRKDYYYGNPLRIPRLVKLAPVDENANRVYVLTEKTNPTSDQYIALAKSGQEFIADCRVRRWMGDIWVRETLYARAQ